MQQLRLPLEKWRRAALLGAIVCSLGAVACDEPDPNRPGFVAEPDDEPETGEPGAPTPEEPAPQTPAPEPTPDTPAPEPTPDTPAPEPTPDVPSPDTPAPESPEPEGPTGFVGSPCAVDADCPFEDGVCQTDGYPQGVCTAACDRFCPDLDGHPTTFCVAAADLEGDIATIGDGACHSRCDFGAFPNGGCRTGYGCAEVARANEPDTTRLVCLPGEQTSVSDCQLELAALGVAFEPTIIADRSPEGQPGLVCHVEDPVILHPPIFGVDLVYYNGDPTPNVTASCEMALALAQTADDVATVGVEAIRHIGTYNCRVIAGTSTLSRHSFGDAIDIFGFDMDDGRLVTLEDHWEHDTDFPVTVDGQLLYESAHRWHDNMLWNIILTPNYNAAHDNHFHIDLSPDSHFLGALEELFFIGENPTGD